VRVLGFLSENHNKYHVGIDLHQEEGKELFRRWFGAPTCLWKRAA
jgi:crotonobetainyl-CoA:carnitine CoA-transferase CaiB-like acyl-CoA transferase